MGQVFLATSPSARLVAVKVIRPEFAADPEFRARFTREVANARNVSGRFTAAPLDADTEGPVPWLATAYIPGPPLSAAVREHGPLPMPSLLPLGAGLAKALAAIHAAGIVHRDLKPSNVLLATDGPRVIDFGISHAVEATKTSQAVATQGSHGSATASPSPTPTAITRTTPTPAKQSAPAAVTTTPAADTTTSAAPPTTPSARHSSPASSPASSAPVSSAGDLSATNATLHSCGDHPIAGASSTSASFEWVNNSSNTVYVYYTESSVYAGLTGSIPPNSSLGSTLAVGGTYLVDGPIGTCLGYITIDGTSGEVTIS